MAKKESTFINMLLTLFLVTFVSSAALGYVYEATKGPKAAAELARKTEAIKEVVPAFDNDPINERYNVSVQGMEFTCYPAKKDGQLIATAVEAITNKGFGGEIKLVIGFLTDGKINDIVVVEHKETPGLGDKIEKQKSKFSAQFKEKDPALFKLAPKKDGGQVDAITAATVSSRAFCDAVEQGYKAYKRTKEDESAEEF